MLVENAESTIATVTPNPSLDLLFRADRLAWDDANRVPAPRLRPGGQGINVARGVCALGGTAVAVAPLGGAMGRDLERLLTDESIDVRAVPIAGDTRVFVAAAERETGRSLLLNPRGPELAPHECEALLDAVRDLLRRDEPRWLACCGSLPPGVPPAFYADVARLAAEHGSRFVADCDGAALRRAAGSACDLLVPNRYEAERLLGCTIDDVDDAGAAASALLRHGSPLAVVTLGVDGAVAATDRGVWHAIGPRIAGGTAVGAGDALLAGLLLALDRGAGPADALRAGVAAGTAVLHGRGRTLLERGTTEALIREVRLRRLG